MEEERSFSLYCRSTHRIKASETSFDEAKSFVFSQKTLGHGTYVWVGIARYNESAGKPMMIALTLPFYVPGLFAKNLRMMRTKTSRFTMGFRPKTHCDPCFFRLPQYISRIDISKTRREGRLSPNCPISLVGALVESAY
jgi:hypothetical protein